MAGLFQVFLSLSLLLFHFTVFRCMSGKKEGRQATKKRREREKINFKTVYNKKKPSYFEAKLYATTANLSKSQFALFIVAEQNIKKEDFLLLLIHQDLTMDLQLLIRLVKR